MTLEGERPAHDDDRPASSTMWPGALFRGFLVVLVVAGIGIVAAICVFVFADPSLSLVGALRIGALYLGPFHHVAVVFEGDLDVDALRLPGSGVPAGGAATVEVGVAFLAFTALAAWLLFRAGRASGSRVEGGALARALAGAIIAPGYALPVFLVALLVSFEERVRIGSFVTGQVRVSLSVWQALVFPLVLAAVAGATGGLWSWLAVRRAEPRAARADAVLAGGWRMFLVGAALSYLGLFVAGVVQPDEPVALLTPSTARYYRSVLERPGLGAVILGHHVALSPNEAIWTLVAAEGACDVVRGSESADLLCYGSFPEALDPLTLEGRPSSATSRTAPAGYFLFLLVPAVATVLGGRWAARRADLRGRAAVGVGAAAGVVFAVLVAAGCLLSSVTLSYGASSGGHAGGGELWLGPDPISGTLLALVWGVAGGALGAAGAAFRESTAVPRPAR